MYACTMKRVFDLFPSFKCMYVCVCMAVDNKELPQQWVRQLLFGLWHHRLFQDRCLSGGSRSRYVCMYVCMYERIYLCMKLCCVYVWRTKFAYVFGYLCMHRDLIIWRIYSMYVCMYVYMYVCMYVCMHACIRNDERNVLAARWSSNWDGGGI